MMLSQNEIRARAVLFSKEWEDSGYEKGETQTFYNEFFEMFGIRRRDVAMYEKQIKKLNDKNGFIDLFWPKVLLVEQKSSGRDLERAQEQAEEYFLSLDAEQRPRYMLSCDFQNFQLIDLDESKEHHFTLEQLADNIEHLDFMRGIVRPNYETEYPVSIKASEMMGEIYDNLRKSGYDKHDMEYMLTRLTYCLFADDTGIFEPRGILHEYLQNRTSRDGTDLGAKMIQLFEVLNTDMESRQSNLDEELNKFPYIDGELFKRQIRIPAFDSKMRDLLIKASEFDWADISPAIFGSLFQSVMDDRARHDDGAHYTSEANIMKVIEPLFLDELRNEFTEIKTRKDRHRKKELEAFQDKLADLKFLDPACGAGNFLIISYKAIRKLELDVIREIHDRKKQRLDVSGLSKVNVDQFYGIETNEFSSRIAEVALWMMDHLMNNELSGEYGLSYTRIPLKKHPNICNADALEMNWNDLLSGSDCSYVLGNPPYGGSKIQSKRQRDQVKRIANLGGSGGTLDYVTAWFFKTCEYIPTHTHTFPKIGFVATNSITQGEQVGQLWPALFERYEVDIIFAHRSFKWESEAKGKAHVTVVIIGLAKDFDGKKRLFHYEDGKIIEEQPEYISAYLIGIEKQLPIVEESSKPINGLSRLVMGSKPIDDGNYIFTDEEKKEFLSKEPNAEKFLKPYVNAKDFLNNRHRWILALHNAKPHELKNLPHTKDRIQAVRAFRLASISKPTKKLAETPQAYHLNVIPDKSFLMIPRVSSERREYIPITYMEPPIIPSDAMMVLQNASLGLFGLLTSKMHMLWMKVVGGKLETRFRYSAGLVYNTFPVPDTPFDSVEKYAQNILDARKKYPESSLADMYDPDIMPSDLKKAHLALDKAVDKLYRKDPFVSNHDRMEFLLERYGKMTST